MTALLATLLALAAAGPGGRTVAAWSFDAVAPCGAAPRVEGTGPRGGPLFLGTGARLAPGRNGQALLPGAAGMGPAACLGSPATDVSGTPLALGPGGWGIECRLRLDAGGEAEGVIVAAGRGETEVSLALRPAESAFVFRGLAPAAEPGAPLAGRAVELPDPAGPPHRRARELVVLLPAGAPLPRDRWFEVVLAHDGAGVLRLWIDGQPAAGADAPLAAAPAGTTTPFTVGSDARGARRFPGAIDHLRVRAAAEETR